MEQHIEWQNWEQLRLLPASTIRVEVVVFVDGPTETATVGLKVTEAETDEIIELAVGRALPWAEAFDAARAVLSAHLLAASQHVAPF